MQPTLTQRDKIIEAFAGKLDFEAMAILLACGELEELVCRYRNAGLHEAVYTAEVDDSDRLDEVMRRANLFVTDPMIYQIMNREPILGRRTVRMHRFHLPKAMTPEDAVRLIRLRKVTPCCLAELVHLGMEFPLLAQENGIVALGSLAVVTGITHFPALVSLDGNRQLRTRKVPPDGTLPKDQVLLVKEDE